LDPRPSAHHPLEVPSIGVYRRAPERPPEYGQMPFAPPPPLRLELAFDAEAR
jgi:hypothetical protein